MIRSTASCFIWTILIVSALVLVVWKAALLRLFQQRVTPNRRKKNQTAVDILD